MLRHSQYTQVAFRSSFSGTWILKTGTLDYSLEVCKNHLEISITNWLIRPGVAHSARSAASAPGSLTAVCPVEKTKTFKCHCSIERTWFPLHSNYGLSCIVSTYIHILVENGGICMPELYSTHR